MRTLHEQSLDTGDRVTKAVRRAVDGLRNGLEHPTNAELNELISTFVGPMEVQQDGSQKKKRALGGSSQGTAMKVVAGVGVDGSKETRRAAFEYRV